MARSIVATFEYSGMSDYWSGNGRRWEDDAACAFASYGPTTTLRDLLDEWEVDYSDMEGKEAWEEVEDGAVREALLAMLTEEGRANLDAIWKPSAEWAREIESDSAHKPEEDYCECAGCENARNGDSPIAVVLLEIVESEED